MISNLLGKKIGALTVIKCLEQRKNRICLWLCQCDCGNYVIRSTVSLHSSENNKIFATCGCLHKSIDGIEKSVVGQTFGNLKVIKFNKDKLEYFCKHKDKDLILSPKLLNARIYTFNKNADKRKATQLFLLKYNCQSEEEYNQCSIRLHHILFMMKLRCYNTSCPQYKYYGGRGIKVCDEWLKNSKSFVLWALSNGYSKELQIDRTDNNGNYEPTNCRWVSKLENANNTRRNVYIEYNGKTQTLSKWCRELNISYKHTHYLIKRKGLSLEDCVKKLSKSK